MFDFQKSAVAFLLSLVLMLSFSACTGTKSDLPEADSIGQLDSFSQQTKNDAEETESSDLANSSQDKRRQEYLNSLTIDDAPVDLNDLEAVTRVYVDPLVGCGNIWNNSWNTPSEIPADNLIDICAYNNFLNLPRDFEGVYIPGHEYAPADQVEASLQKYFDVKSSYIKTSQWYDPENDTYLLGGGFGGGVWAKAISAEQNEDKIIIQVGLLCSINEDELEEMGDTVPAGLRSPSRILTPNGILVPSGTLIIKLQNNNIVGYLSYQLNEGFEW